MKKFTALLLALCLIVCMAFPVMAVTPDLNPPAIPTIPDISDDVEFELPDSAFDEFIPDIEFDVENETEAPTEAPAETKLPDHIWVDWLRVWYRWIFER